MKAITQLSKGTDALSKVSERLASGMRINHASDDPAGLALAMGLSADTRIAAQGVRNISDGISLLSVADSALEALSSISERQAELAAQAANGTLSGAQRLLLDREANALVQEFNRIVNTTSFNGLNLLDGSLGNFTIQAGSGANSSISSTIATGLSHTAGTGSFTSTFTVSGMTDPIDSDSADFNNDGYLDLIIANNSGSVSVALGNGNGTFGARTSLAGATNAYSIVAADLNNDGNTDFVGVGNTTLFYRLGNGNGTFGSNLTLTTPAGTVSVVAGDLNGDNILDLSFGSTGGSLGVFLGNGNGTFGAISTYSSGGYTTSTGQADFNGDGILDLFAVNDLSQEASILLGNGNGTFRSRISISTGGTEPYKIVAGDFTGDGINDLLIGDYTASGFGLVVGNGDGSFKAVTSYVASSSIVDIEIGDINGDGKLDFATASYSSSPRYIYFGNGNGTFQAAKSIGSGKAYGVELADFNNDGALDLSATRFTLGEENISLSQTMQVSTISALNLTTTSNARTALETISDTITRISAGRGSIGALMSRYEFAMSHLSNTKDNLEMAHGRISDVDVAESVTELVRLQVLQQARTAVLAQANQSPAILLKLIQSGEN